MEYNLKQHLDMCSLKDLKDLVRKFNLKNKIKLGQKKEQLIADLLKHFENELSADGMLKQPAAEFEMPKMDHSVKKEKKPRVRKNSEEMEKKMEEKKPVEVVVVKVEKEEPKMKKVRKLVIKKVVEKVVEKMVEPVKAIMRDEKAMYAFIDSKLKDYKEMTPLNQAVVVEEIKSAVAEYEKAGEKLFKRNPVKYETDSLWFVVKKRGGKK